MRIELTQEWLRHMPSESISRFRGVFPDGEVTRNGLLSLQEAAYSRGGAPTVYGIAKKVLNDKEHATFWVAHLRSQGEMDREVGEQALDMEACIESARARLSLADLLPVIKRQRSQYEAYKTGAYQRHSARVVDAFMALAS